MPVQFILGRPGTGKTAHCLTEIRERLHRSPEGRPLIYIVPEHMTFSLEYAFAATPGLGGMTRLNVYSMPRLALRVLQQAGGATRKHLNATGISMLLRKIVEKNKSRLRLYQKSSGQSGFYDLLGDTLIELKRFCLEPEEIAAEAQSLSGDSADNLILKDKLHDLSLIYHSFSQALEGKYIDSEDYLRLMVERMGGAGFLKEAEVWIDGFHSMTPQELLVAEQLMVLCRKVTIVIGADRVYDRAPDEFSVFRHPALLFLQLKERAEQNGLDVAPVILKKDVVRPETESLKSLILHFGQYPVRQALTTDGIFMTEAANRREEVEQAARQMLQCARKHGDRFRDMTVLVRHLDDYRDLIRTVFADYQIPFFIDQKLAMKHHPLIEFIRSALELIQQNWHYEPVFRCAKTDFLIPLSMDLQTAREGMDQLENYVMAHGYYGKKWLDGAPWPYRVYRGLEETADDDGPSEMEKETEKIIHRYRQLVARPLAALEQQLKAEATVAGKCVAVYHFLTELMVPEKLERMAAEAEQRGRLAEARTHGQAWKAVIDLLDQCVETAGDEQMTLELFGKIIDTGLDALEFALVPPALDQVMVGSLDRMRSADVKDVFLLGVNEGILPAKPADQGLLSGEDRDLLQEEGMAVGEGESGQMALENEWIYRALALSKRRLFISYPLASEDGESLRPSPLIARLRRFFPTAVLRRAPAEPRALDEREQLSFVNVPRKTMGILAAQIRQWKVGYPMADLWWDVYNWFTVHREWGNAARMAFAGLFARNEARLNPRLALDLYGQTIQTSVSRMETFNACPFSQFASYGLHLKEREVFQLTAPDIGQLFHLAIKQMTARLMREQKDWRDLSPEDCDRLAAAAVDVLAPRLQRQILTSSNRYRYLQHKLAQVVARVARVFNRHARQSGFSPLGLELPFGPGQPLPPLSFSLKSGTRMQVVGRIDRVDRANDDRGRLLLRVVDYKSRARDLDLTEVYYGLALQMLTYLDVVITNSKQWLGTEAEPAGVLYFHVHNPVLNLDMKLSEAQMERELYRHFKTKGLLLEDKDALLLTDRDAEGGMSDIAPFGIKKDGDFYKSSALADKEDFTALRHYTREKMVEAGDRIVAGDVSITPFKLNGRIPCGYCPFRPVCRFDQSQPGNHYRLLNKIDDKQVLRAIKKSEEGGGTGEK